MKRIYSFFITVSTCSMIVIGGGCITVPYEPLPEIPKYTEFSKKYDHSAAIEIIPNENSEMENELRLALANNGYRNFSRQNYYHFVQNERIRLITVLDFTRQMHSQREGVYLDTRIIVSVREPGVLWNNKLIYRKPRYFQAFSRCFLGNQQPLPSDYASENNQVIANLFMIDQFRSALAPSAARKDIDQVAPGSPEDMWQLSKRYQNDASGNHYEALRWAFLAANSGHKAALRYFADNFDQRNVNVGHNTLLGLLEKSAAQGHIRSIIKVGLMYRDGMGCKADAKTAYFWFLQAANTGNAQAQFYVASALETGNGVKKNIKQAMVYYKLAAAQNYEEAVDKVEALSSCEEE